MVGSLSLGLGMTGVAALQKSVDPNLVVRPYAGGSPENWVVTDEALVGAAGAVSSTGYLNLREAVATASTYRVEFTVSGAVGQIGARFGESSWFDGGTAYGPFGDGSHSIDIAPSSTEGRIHFGAWSNNSEYATVTAVSVVKLA